MDIYLYSELCYAILYTSKAHYTDDAPTQRHIQFHFNSTVCASFWCLPSVHSLVPLNGTGLHRLAPTHNHSYICTMGCGYDGDGKGYLEGGEAANVNVTRRLESSVVQSILFLWTWPIRAQHVIPEYGPPCTCVTASWPILPSTHQPIYSIPPIWFSNRPENPP